jgi:TnpA family transposase
LQEVIKEYKAKSPAFRKQVHLIMRASYSHHYRSCSSSEVAAMIEGLLRHCTSAEIQKNYVDTHGQSEVAFAFCHLLGFRLLPRLKNIAGHSLRGLKRAIQRTTRICSPS